MCRFCLWSGSGSATASASGTYSSGSSELQPNVTLNAMVASSPISQTEKEVAKWGSKSQSAAAVLEQSRQTTCTTSTRRLGSGLPSIENVLSGVAQLGKLVGFNNLLSEKDFSSWDSVEPDPTSFDYLPQLKYTSTYPSINECTTKPYSFMHDRLPPDRTDIATTRQRQSSNNHSQSCHTVIKVSSMPTLKLNTLGSLGMKSALHQNSYFSKSLLAKVLEGNFTAVRKSTWTHHVPCNYMAGKYIMIKVISRTLVLKMKEKVMVSSCLETHRTMNVDSCFMKIESDISCTKVERTFSSPAKLDVTQDTANCDRTVNTSELKTDVPMCDQAITEADQIFACPLSPISLDCEERVPSANNNISKSRFFMCADETDSDDSSSESDDEDSEDSVREYSEHSNSSSIVEFLDESLSFTDSNLPVQSSMCSISNKNCDKFSQVACASSDTDTIDICFSHDEGSEYDSQDEDDSPDVSENSDADTTDNLEERLIRLANEKWNIGYVNQGQGDEVYLTSQNNEKPMKKKVRFTDQQPRIYHLVEWALEAYQARCGPWEQLARDAARFKRHIQSLETSLNTVLDCDHRANIYASRFS